jgi:hypothetical protein
MQDPRDLTITFVANAGYLLESGDKKVAVDEIFNHGPDTNL